MREVHVGFSQTQTSAKALLYYACFQICSSRRDLEFHSFVAAVHSSSFTSFSFIRKSLIYQCLSLPCSMQVSGWTINKCTLGYFAIFLLSHTFLFFFWGAHVHRCLTLRHRDLSHSGMLLGQYWDYIDTLSAGLVYYKPSLVFPSCMCEQFSRFSDQ